MYLGDIAFRCFIAGKRSETYSVEGLQAFQDNLVIIVRNGHDGELMVTAPAAISAAVRASREGEEVDIVIVGAEFQHRARARLHLVFRLRNRVCLRYEAGAREPYFHGIVRRELQDINPSAVTEVLIREILHNPGLAG